jgi:CDGSH-type Zn-finger protein
MSEPKIGGREPVTVDVKAGESYWWCRCGRSQTQPFCDGSHEVTDFQPLEWTAKRDGKRNFCTCKRTKTPPFCDNSHLKL